jgi:hypothetical protein
MIIGTGAGTSAVSGENIVIIFAPMLHKPKAVPAKMAGKMVEFAR